jgi:hypothetical protein
VARAAAAAEVASHASAHLSFVLLFWKGDPMKRKENLKMENPKVIDPSVLEAILGGVQPAGDGKSAAVIEQAPFASFFHS